MPRLIIVSNRLPITVKVSGGDVSIVPSAGGLTTALRALHQRGDSLWIGWTGHAATLDPTAQRALDAHLLELRTVPVPLEALEVTRYYDGLSSGTLWPVLHQFLETARFDEDGGFERYEAINARFAEIAAARYQPGDALWVHDYHLLLAAAMLRERLPRARIGFFLHTPFPSPEVFCALPFRDRLLRGVLGADVVGFQTASCRRNFARAVARLLGVVPAPGDDAVTHQGHRARLGVYPVGVDAAALGALAGHAAVRDEARRIREQAPGRRIVLGVDRLDYTKGIPLRLAAVERLLDRALALRDVRFVQLAVPTREGIGAYEAVRREVEERAARINARHGAAGAPPVELLCQTAPIERLVAMYASADVMLVTPLRDGMNLVAKEYVAARLDDTGALVLSEFAGAAEELQEALIVNPYDVGAVAAAIERALSMPPPEQRARMTALRRRVTARDVHGWARSFLGDLEET